VLAAIAVSVLASTLAGCGKTEAKSATPPAPATSTTTKTTTTTTKTATTIDPGHVVPAAPGPTTLPTEDAITPIRQDFDTGQQVVITAHGFEPLELSATIGQPVVWTNISGMTQQITIVGLIRSPRIPPGAQFVWTPNFGGSIAYHSATGSHAVLILQ
jgi:plastocyanin